MEIHEKALQGLVSYEEYYTLTREQQEQYDKDSIGWENARQMAKKELADVDDVKDSFKKLAPIMTEMPPPERIKSFAAILLECKITKWEVEVATMEIIRTKSKMTAPCEYFSALERIKTKLASQGGHNIFHDNALDF